MTLSLYDTHDRHLGDTVVRDSVQALQYLELRGEKRGVESADLYEAGDYHPICRYRRDALGVYCTWSNVMPEPR